MFSFDNGFLNRIWEFVTFFKKLTSSFQKDNAIGLFLNPRFNKPTYRRLSWVMFYPHLDIIPIEHVGSGFQSAPAHHLTVTINLV